MVELIGPAVETVRASFLYEHRRASRGGIAGLGEATTNLSPPLEDHFPHPSFPKKHTLQAEELARAGRERAAPAGPSSWCMLPAWRKICHFCSTLHGGSLEFFQAKGKIIERQKQTWKFNPGTSQWCCWLGKEQGRRNVRIQTNPSFHWN